jgi:probable DNA metabolism protein
MQVVMYDGSFEGWLCAVFDIYEYKFQDASICREDNFNGNIFENVHTANMESEHSNRVWKGLAKKLPQNALRQIHWAFLSGEEGIENTLLSYVRYAFTSGVDIASDFSHPAVLTITQMAKKIAREKHRMEAFVRFQQTQDELYYAVIEPDFDVLDLIAPHFKKRYADQRWLIYDGKRKFGLYYDMQSVEQVQINFSEELSLSYVASVYAEGEDLYQCLWQHYFKSVNIEARKNTRLHIQHMPRRYWKHLTEKMLK